MENNINMTTDSLDVVSFTNISITNDNIPKEDIEEEKKQLKGAYAGAKMYIELKIYYYRKI